ncbi:MAG: hypothetical protein ACOY4T_11385 [Pseudomonadota bacterium]
MSRKKIALIATLSTVWPTIATPQAGGGGLQVDLGFETSLTADDNFQLAPRSPGSSWIWDNRLNFAISNATPNQNLNVTGSGVLRFADFPGRSTTGFEDPQIRFSYSVDSRNSRLTVDARYRNVDREFLNPFQVEQEEQNSGGLYAGGGSVRFINYGLRYETGLNAPFGMSFSLRRDEKNFSNVTNPRLFDSTTDTAGVTARFDVSPVTQVTANALQTWYSAEDLAQTDRETLDLSLGLRQDVNPSLVLDARLGYTTIDETRFGGPRNRSGATGSFGLTQALPNGDVSGSISTTQDVNGSRTTLQFGRTIEMPRSTLSGSVGLSRGDSGSTDWIARVAYNYQLQTSSFSASLTRTAATNSLDEDVLDTRISLGYGYEVSTVSRINVDVNYGLSEDAGAGSAPTVKRTDITAAYTRELTQDWNLRGGVTIRDLNDSSAAGRARSNAVFLSLGRSFSFRP